MQIGAGLALEKELVAVVEPFGRDVRGAVGIDIAPDLRATRRSDSKQAEHHDDGEREATESGHLVILPRRLRSSRG